MKHGSEWVKEQLSSEVAWHRGKLKAALGHLDPEIFTIAVATLNKSEIEHHTAIDNAFSDENMKLNAIQGEYDAASESERATLMDVCSYVCASSEEYRVKGDYLASLQYSGIMDSEHHMAVIDAMKSTVNSSSHPLQEGASSPDAIEALAGA